MGQAASIPVVPPGVVFYDDFEVPGSVSGRPLNSSLYPAATLAPGTGSESVAGGVLYTSSTTNEGYVYSSPAPASLPREWVAEFVVLPQAAPAGPEMRLYLSAYIEAGIDQWYGFEAEVRPTAGTALALVYGESGAGYWEGRDEATDPVNIVAPAGPTVLRVEHTASHLRVLYGGVLVASAVIAEEPVLAGVEDNNDLLVLWSRMDIDSMSMAATVQAQFESVFGTPRGTNVHRTLTIGEATRFGTPTTPRYTTHQAQGFNNSRFGVPYSAQPFVFGGTAQVTYAPGWMATKFGTPAATVNTTGQAQGWQAAQFGTPRYTCVLSVESTGMLTQFGTPTAGSGHRAQGFRATQFGTPTCAAGYLAQGFSRTRFGTPRASLPGALVARGWCSTRFGTPRGSLPPPGHAAEGFSTTQFGVPTATIRHRAATLGPLSRFGRPTLRRNPTC